MSDSIRAVHDVIQTWASRGKIVPAAAGYIEDDLVGVIQPLIDQGFDTDAARITLEAEYPENPIRGSLLDRLAGCVRPAQGIMLTRAEARVLDKVTGRMTSTQVGTAVLDENETNILAGLLGKLGDAS